MKIDDKLSDVFGTEPIKIEGEVLPAVETKDVTHSSKIEDDYDKARTNIHDLLEKGTEALTSALEVAKQSEHPRAFEVVGNLVKQLTDVNQQLLDLHQQKQKLDTPKAGEKTVTNNNAIFVGSTAELTKMIKNMNKGES
jgi:DNA polymerase II large subunit